ncbi:MAG: hypothetical protein P8H33_02345 [Crocinitomicaceae bacterium]|nr:hypothetical protein [Crocinitomicaceae bacterium]
MDGRTISNGNYRYGFNGQETDEKYAKSDQKAPETEAIYVNYMSLLNELALIHSPVTSPCASEIALFN